MDAELLARVGRSESGLQPYQETPDSVEKKQLVQMIKKFKDERRKFHQRLNQIEGNPSCPEAATACMAASLRDVIDALDRNIASLEKRLIAQVGKDAKLIATIPGLSVKNAALIVAELGDVSRFRSRNQVTAFAGLDPIVHESGSSVRGRSRISKRGSTRLRGSLGQAAWGLKMHNPHFIAYAEKLKTDGKHYFTILVAMARKLLLLIASMLRTRRVYDPGVKYPNLELTSV
jgi:transposase